MERAEAAREAGESFERGLAAEVRAARGVYFTPKELVGWMVRSVDSLLRRDLGCARGLADRRVHVLDPAAGAGVFLHGVVEHAGSAAVRGRLHARELLAEPLGIARASLEGVAEVLAGDALRLELDPARASRVPSDAVLVVLGNPPYRGDAPARRGAIERLMEDYKRAVRGEERQIQRLSNDYVRFLRLAQHLVEERGRGVVAFVTDAGYMDGVLFRGVREELLRASSSAYVLDLGGGARGRAGDARDENVFAIRQPVALSLFVVGGARRPLHVARVRGRRADKLALLAEGDVTTTAWEAVDPAPPARLFRPPPRGAPHDAYARWLPLPRAAGTGDPAVDRDRRYGTGVKTRHDAFVVAFDPEGAAASVRRLAAEGANGAALARELRLCTTAHFDLAAARARARAGDLERHVRPLAYRPFDTRYVVYLREFVCEPKLRTMAPMLDVPGNVALCVLRRDRRGTGGRGLVAQGLVAKDYVSNLDDALVWPLFARAAGARPSPNVAPRFLDAFSGDAHLALHWIYAVLHAPWYRRTFEDALSAEYPRLPLPASPDALRALAPLGARLVDVHLLRAAPRPRATGEDARSVWIGGYRPADAWLRARRGRELGEGERAHHARIVGACLETRELVCDLDRAIADLGGWRAAFASAGSLW